MLLSVEDGEARHKFPPSHHEHENEQIIENGGTYGFNMSRLPVGGKIPAGHATAVLHLPSIHVVTLFQFIRLLFMTCREEKEQTESD